MSQSSIGIDPVSQMYLQQVELVENDVLSLALAVPADQYGFVPAGGNFQGVRTLGQQIRHLATLIYLTAALSIPEESPVEPGTNDNGPDTIRSKEEVIEYLKDAISYARRAMALLTVHNHLDTVPTYFGPMPRAAVAAGVAYHSYNHYGQMVVYARLMGIVPPSSGSASTS